MIKLAIFVVTLAKLTAAQHGYGGYGVSNYGGGQRGYGGGNRGYGGGNRGYGGRNGGYGVKKSYGGGYGVNVDYYSYQSYNGLYPGKSFRQTHTVYLWVVAAQWQRRFSRNWDVLGSNPPTGC